MELTYTQASAADAEAIFALCKKLIDDYEDPALIDYEKVLAWVRRKIDTCIAEYTCVFLEGEKVAYYRFHPEDGMMEMDDLYVLPGFRGRGIGTAILKKCLRDTDLPVMLFVFTRNTGAFRLYERMGFAVTKHYGHTRCAMVRQPDREVL